MDRHVDEEALQNARNMPCMACSDLDPQGALEAVFEGNCRSHPHHVKTRGSGGGDYAENLMPLCHIHHREVHRTSLSHFASKYKTVTNWLHLAGWTERGKKWRHDGY